MLFSIDSSGNEITKVPSKDHARLDIYERDDLEEWIIREPRLLDEELMIISSEYSMFEDTHDRLDILALDGDGNLVVAELKRDRADRTTDLQAIKYASYCSNLTAEKVQKDYRTFWNDRNGDEQLTPEEVGRIFANHLNEGSEEEVVTIEEGWADFDLDDEPRIILAAGRYGTEVTSPVMWLSQEYGMDISCVKIIAYEHEGKIILSSRQLVPPPEAEEYMTRRREKKKEQSEGYSDTKKMYLTFWRKFRDFVRKNSDFDCTTPKPRSHFPHRIGLAGTFVSSNFSKFNSAKESFSIGELRVELVLSSGNEKREEIYRFLEDHRSEIEQQIDQDVQWSNPEGTQRKRIVVRRDAEVENRENWDEYQNWLLEYVKKFHDVFLPILNSEF